MGWDFEHWDNGKVYLHIEKWEAFRKEVERNGNGYPHNWNHHRLFVQIHTPRSNINDLPVHENFSIDDVDIKWSTIYQPYPAFIRTDLDPEGWEESWNMWAEDGHKDPIIGEKFEILTLHPRCRVIRFRNKYWINSVMQSYGFGPNPPPPKPKIRKYWARDIDEE